MSKRVLIIGKVWPEPDSSAAGTHMMQLIHLLKTAHFDIHFACTASPSNYSVNLAKEGVKTTLIQLNDSSFDAFIIEQNPDVVIFDRFMTEEQFGWRVVDNCPDALRILNSEDLHGLRSARIQVVKEGRRGTDIELMNDVMKRELASIHRSDLALIISSFEINLLVNKFNIEASKLIYFPFLFDELKFSDTLKWRPFEERKGFVSIGNFLHEPNRDALFFLKKDIWPLIRNIMPDAEIFNYGAYCSNKEEALHDPDNGFYVMGRAVNVADVIGNAKVCLAALRAGAGLKGKLFDCMRYGTPVVTTSIGAEAVCGDLPINGHIADDVQAFATNAVKLFNNSDLWNASLKNGIEIINQRFTSPDIGFGVINGIKRSIQNINELREKNITGSLLMHQTSNASKYMSKWIEEKNKRSSS